MSTAPAQPDSLLPRVLEPEVMDTRDEAIAYEQMDHNAPIDAIVQKLQTLHATGRILDLGVGPGHFPIAVCQRIAGCRVVGVDMAFEMLALAAGRCAASRVGDRIALLYADAKRLPLADDCFDAVYSNTVLHHLPDPVPFLAEAWRVLRPGGALIIRDLYRPASAQRLQELVAIHAADNTDMQKQLLADSLHAALTPAELTAAAHAAGVRNFQITIDTDRHMTLQSPRT